LPLFVKSGSIVPIGPEITYADEQPDAPLELHIYPGQSGSFTLYDDEGDNYNYEQGHYAMIPLSWDEATRRLTLHDRQGSYPGMPASREFRIVVGNSPYIVASDGISTRTIFYEGREISIEL
jgi:alpha-D-xyloside xylohydrolase